MSKVQIIETVSEAVPAETATLLATLKKDNELVAQAEAQLAGKRWVPNVLRPCSAPPHPGGLRVVTAMSA